MAKLATASLSLGHYVRILVGDLFRNIIYNISILRNAKAVNHLIYLRFSRIVKTVCLAAPDLQECRQEAAPPLLHWDTALVGQKVPV